MSWLYSIIITGLAIAGHNGASITGEAFEIAPQVSVERADQDVTERFERTYPFNSDGRISLSNINGSVVVEAWDRNEVRLEAVKTADSAETMAMIEILIEATANRISIETEYKRANYSDKKEWSGRRSEVNYKLFVPRTAVLNEVETVNGSVNVADMVNSTRVSAVNGTVIAKNLQGTASLSTVNGTIECEFQKVDGDGKISLSTVNGRVRLILPSNVNATVKADTLNGGITNDFGLPVRKGEFVGRDLYGRIGSGEGQIKLDSVNGQLSIEKKNDWLPQSPSVNLMPDRANGGVEGASSSSQVDRAVASNVRATRAQAAAAMRQAQREMEKIGPELEKLKMADLEKLKNLKIDIPEVAMTAEIAEGLRVAADSLASIRDANFAFGTPRLSKQSRTIPVSGKPILTIDATGCQVFVKGGDVSDVQYSFTEMARGRTDGKAKIVENIEGNSIKLSVEGDDLDGSGTFRYSRRYYRLEVTVPRNSDVSVKTDGEVRVSGINGGVTISGEDNSINVRDVEGVLNVSASGGQVRIIGFSGELVTATESGPVFLEGRFRSIRSKTTDSKLVLTLPKDPNATIISDRAVSHESATLVPEGVNKWRLGNGDAKYNFQLGDGSLMIRNASELETR